MKASVLGIGTELTDGQITNKNASWISAQLKSLGLTTSIHIAVPDEQDLMMRALKICAEESELIFVTGGLGPTSDDFTRDVVNAWAGTKLEFDESSWQHVYDRLTSRGYVPKEIQKQQCYFPGGAKVLKNNHGTANAFQMHSHGKHVFVLPGPPREIESVWQDHIAGWLNKNFAHIDPFVTRKWDTLGLGESDVAVMTEEALAGVEVLKGYRVHLPYVEVKVSYHRSEEKKYSAPIEKLEQALKAITISRDGEDLVETLAAKLAKASSFHFADEASDGFLLNRIQPLFKKISGVNWSFANRDTSASSEIVLKLLSSGENQARATLNHGENFFAEEFSSPYKTTNMLERRKQYFAERALIFWARNL